MKHRFLLPLAGFVAATLGLTALLYLCAWWLRPDVVTPPVPPPADELAVVEASRAQAKVLDLAHPPVIVRAVDYAEGASAKWWPKGQSPLLADLVKEGKLPPVAERVGPEPVVLQGVDGIGRFGGSWYRLANANFDLTTIYWRLSSSNLVRWSPQGYPIVPHVAKSWEISSDYRVFTFTLRQGMRWSDGHPLTSEDIYYWYKNEIKYFNIQPRFLRAGDSLGVVEKLDDLHIRFSFARPNPLFIERLASVGMNYDDYTEHIVPAHYLRSYHPELGDPAVIRRAMDAFKLSSPVAVYRRIKNYLNPEHPRLWPWVYHTYQPTSPQVFVRNPYYFAVDPAGNQLPYLDRLVVDIKTNNLIAVAASNGELSMQDRHIRYEDHILLLGNASRYGYEVYHWKPSTQSLFTIFPNLNRRVDPARPDTKFKNALLNDRRFRQALSLAINRGDIIAAEFNGQTEPAQIAPPADSPFHNSRLSHAFIEHDPARANALLDELGLTGRDTEGYRTFPGGSRMTFTLNLTDYAIEGPAQFVVDDWEAVGVRAVIKVRARKLFEQEKLTYEHDFTVWTGESEFYPLAEPRNFVPTYWESYYAPAYGIWYQNGGLYGDPASRRPNSREPPIGHPIRRSMELLEETKAMPDEADRRAHFNQILEIGADNLWTISISTPPPQLVVVKNGFRNVPRTALFAANLQSPGNTGIETYFWEHPSDPAAVVAQTKQEIVTITPTPRTMPTGVEAGLRGTDRLATWLGALAGVAVVLSLVLVGTRHPLIGHRLLLMIPTLFVVSIIVFVLVQLPPGDYVETRVARLEMEGTASNDELAAELRKNFGLDQTMLRRYAHWMGFAWFVSFDRADTGLLQGNLGLSMEHEKAVSEVIGDRIVLTVLVSLTTILFTWAVALPLGIYSAARQYSAVDYALTFLGFLGMSIPSFLLALVVMFLARRWLGVNIDGIFSPAYATMTGWSWGKLADLAKHIWLPVIVLGAGGAAGMIRVMRANLLDELKKPYVVTARAKGVRPLKLMLKYPVRLALNPFVSSLGNLFPQFISGGTIVAMVLSLPMVGPALFDALLVEDVYLASSLLLVLSLLGIVGTLVSDLLLLWLDPRIRLNIGHR